MFQTLDDKNECVAVYVNGEINKKSVTEECTATWSYSPYLKGKQIDYAQLYVECKTITEIVPEHLKAEWEAISLRLKSFISSFVEAKVSLKENSVGFLKKQCNATAWSSSHMLRL